jgi:putative FmdB family regulatory protein
MPIYEFSCNNCKSLVSVFVRSMNSPVNGKCESCGSTDLTRLISQVSIPRFGAGGDDSDFDMNDPEMASLMQQMGGGMGGMPGMGGMGGMDDFGGFGDDD